MLHKQLVPASGCHITPCIAAVNPYHYCLAILDHDCNLLLIVLVMKMIIKHTEPQNNQPLYTLFVVHNNHQPMQAI